MEKYGIYIHIPYCASKCIYCDFFSGGVKSANWDSYVTSLLNEFEERKDELAGEPTTLYIGGGTPSLMPVDQFSRLTEGIKVISGKKTDWQEMTIEVNPEDVIDSHCREWQLCGVNRVSMGVQTFSDKELEAIKRRHSASQAIEAIHLLKRYFKNVSLDLMFGLPGQTVESWCQSIDTALLLQPQHISAYSLMLEPGTPLTILNDKGLIKLPKEEDTLLFFKILTNKLKKAGYEQYEISNYALPGHESMHNRSYWLGTPYLGLGPAAHSFDGKMSRKYNPTKIKEYTQRFCYHDVDTSEKEPFYNEEILSTDEMLEEKIMLSMRIKEGLDLSFIKKFFGDKNVNMILRQAQKYILDGKVELINDKLRLSSDGIMIADKIILDILP